MLKCIYGGDKMTYTVKELADLMKVSTRTIRRWIKEGKIRKTANIGAVRVSCGEVERFLKEVK